MKKAATTSTELKVLKERVKKLANDKSYGELLIRMMNRISTSPGLENTVNALMQNILDVIGGTNICLYYLIDQEIYFADAYGARKKLESLDDELVEKVAANREPLEFEEDFSETKMKTADFSKAYTWVFPLVVASDLIGVIKMEKLHIGMRDFHKRLPTFFSYAALILKNEIMGHTRLQKINEELELVNSKLTRQQAFLEAILDNIADGIVACDENGLLTRFNRATREFHGITEEHLTPEQWAGRYNLFLADGVTPMQKDDIPLFRAYEGEIVDNVEMIIVPKEGRVRTLLASGRSMVEESGLKIGAVVSMHDITDRKQAEEELKIAYEKLQELDRMKSMFIASMSHELRTPLNSILGFSSIILDGLSGEINDKQRDQLERVNRAGTHLLSMITDIIDISKIEAGRVESISHDFFLHDVIDQALEAITLEIKETGLALKKNVPQELKMHGDERRLFQCILNLLKNAFKFTESGTVSVTASEEDTVVSIAVSDTGIGIAKEDLAKLFQPFSRIDSHLSVKAGGTGLGLYLTQKLVTEIWHGEIEVESEEGKGSVFRLTVPRDRRLLYPSGNIQIDELER